MLPIIRQYHLDVGLFGVLILGVTAALHLWLKRAGHGGLPRPGWAAVVGVLGIGVVMTGVAGEQERGRLRDRLEGVAPTYAQETELLGHARLTLDTPADDAAYLNIINAQRRWQRVNPTVSDIYTFRRLADGRVVLIADSETDYDRNGLFEGDREQRTDIGEVYDNPMPKLMAAFGGVATFDDVPSTDRWGTWVSAYVPIRRPDGTVDGVLGVDYSARLWLADIARARLGALGFTGLILAILIAAAALVTVTRSEMCKREKLQRQLVDASRQAGMAEVATGVLHNVGNVLNSVNVSATVLTEKMRGSKVSGFGRAAEMIRDNQADFARFVTDDAKGKLLPGYLVKLAEHLAGEQQDVLGELTTLSRNLDHVKQIVASQQTMAKTVDVAERFELCDLMEDAVRLSTTDIDKAGATVHWANTACPHLTADRHAVLQILVNLLSNAAKATQGCPTRRLTIGVDATPDADGTDVARVFVSDTGVGIAQGDLKQLFTHGFTTRKDGHGFGLHHSANAAHNLGGRISAASDGVGHGATFTLTLPLSFPAKGVPCPA